MNIIANKSKFIQIILVGLFFSISGIGLLYYSVVKIADYNKKDKEYLPITGTVISYVYNSDNLMAPIVEYQVNNQTYTAIYSVYSNIPKDIGTKMKLKYDQYNPQNTIWENDSSNILVPFVGFSFTLVGMIILIKEIRERKLMNQESS